MSSSAVAAAYSHSRSWHDLYLKALFEPNREKMWPLIKSAEKALVLREHELFATPNCLAEREAVNSTLHALRVLENCLQSKRNLAA